MSCLLAGPTTSSAAIAVHLSCPTAALTDPLPALLPPCLPVAPRFKAKFEQSQQRVADLEATNLRCVCVGGVGGVYLRGLTTMF
jgi:hypothetical protein